MVLVLIVLSLYTNLLILKKFTCNVIQIKIFISLQLICVIILPNLYQNVDFKQNRNYPETN